MDYLLLIYTDETTDPKPGSPAFQQMLDGYNALTKEVTDKGMMKGANPLQSISTATTVRVRNGRTQTTDGPFAETKEQLGGYYLLDCKDLDEAISYAARIPSAKHGSVEIRPVMVF
jgi:hypothetical protein